MAQVTSRRLKRALAAVAIAAGVLGCAGVALAAHQINQSKGAGYSGRLAAPRASYVVRFEVSPNGKEVTDLRLSNTPLYCAGAGTGAPVAAIFARSTISGAGTFTTEYELSYGPLRSPTTLEITGRFARNGGERGTVTTTYPKTPECSGKSSYTTKG